MANKRSKNKKPAAPNDQKPDIPHELHLPWQFVSIPTINSSSMVVTKSWGSVPRECRNSLFTKTLPLVQIQSPEIAHTTNHIIHVTSSNYKAESNKRNKPFDRCHNLKFIGNSEGSIVWEVDFKFGSHCSIGSTRFMDLKSKIHGACVTYSNIANHFNPITTCLDVVLTGISSPIIITRGQESQINCNMGDLKWLKYSCNLVDPNDPGQGYMRLCTGISFEGKFYALSLQGTLVVLQFGIDHDPLITDLGPGRAVPACSRTRHYREYLLESNGQILLVFLLSKKSVKMVDDVEVFELDVSNLSWVKVRRLWDMTALFLGPNSSMLVYTSELDLGCKSSCIYFTNIEFDGWKIYDMESGCIRDGVWNGFNFTSHI